MLSAGQAIELEWIQQELLEERDQRRPLFPDELKPGESELRVGLQLTTTEGGRQLMAELAYINYLALPELEENGYRSDPEQLLSYPEILDTRFQDPYFNPRLFLLDALIGQLLSISCQEAPYRALLDQLKPRAAQSSAATQLLTEQLDWLQETALPSSFSASSLATFFCALSESPVPEHESPVRLQSRKDGDRFRVDYVQAEYPSTTCVLAGTIQSPASETVRVQFFREGDWLEHWRDSLIQLDADGHFQLTFSLDHPKMVSLFHGYQTMRFYLEPGDTLQFRTNANAFYRDMQMSGSAQAENAFLLDFYHQMRGDTLYRRYDFQLLEKDHNSFFETTQAKETNELAFLTQRASALRPGFTAWMDRDLRLEYAGIQWEAAYRFLSQKGVTLAPSLLHNLQERATLLYRLPPGKHFDFSVEDFLSFQFYHLQRAYQLPDFNSSQEEALAQLLPSKETYVRHALMQLFRRYTEVGALTPSSQWQLAKLLAMTRDSQLIREMRVFAEGNRDLPPAIGFRTLQRGKIAPAWSFSDKEGVKVALEDFAGQKVLLHIGSLENLEIALTDIQLLRESQVQLPEIVHLLAASSRNEFAKQIADKQGLFIYISPEAMEQLQESYFIDNSTNHYFLIGEDGKILANHYDLGTARKLRGTWEKLAKVPAAATWTAEQRIQFWQWLGIGALLLLLISGAILWRRRISAQRERRQRQLLEVELRGIRSQMNPHFLFNAMSSIQNLIRKREQEKADLYLSEFAGLMRKMLRNTAEEFIPLTDEIETLEQYCKLECLRQPFEYTFQVDDRIDAHNTYIPSMILQPIIENAILHGLAPQVGVKELVVQITPGQEGLVGRITDNGIGVIASRRQNGRNGHQSVGLTLVRQRLKLMGLLGQDHLTITDRSTLEPSAKGTLVSITIPVEQ